MLSSQLLKVFAVICTLNFAQAHELTQGDDKSPAPLVQVNFYGKTSLVFTVSCKNYL